ncbi:phosphoribosylglycinamide synthetase C domain-containing protein [Staphylococcus aureus]
MFKTSGGRVILALGEGATIREAQQAAYQRISKINREGLFCRKDIADKALL